MVLGNSRIFRKFPPDPVCQDAVLKLPRQTLSISRGEGELHLLSPYGYLCTRQSRRVYKHTPSHSPEFQKQT